MGIAEIDFKRDENNIIESSTNTFSTEQLNEKFKIDGYQIILPKSWIMSNKSRIMVYVHDKMNIKI